MDFRALNRLISRVFCAALHSENMTCFNAATVALTRIVHEFKGMVCRGRGWAANIQYVCVYTYIDIYIHMYT